MPLKLKNKKEKKKWLKKAEKGSWVWLTAPSHVWVTIPKHGLGWVATRCG